MYVKICTWVEYNLEQYIGYYLSRNNHGSEAPGRSNINLTASNTSAGMDL